MKRFFNPHEGASFRRGSDETTGGLLLLSESAYGWEEDGGGMPGPDHPSENSVKFWALSERFETRGTEGRYIAWLTKALCQTERPNGEQRNRAWAAVAYSIYVQCPMQNLSTKPTQKEFEDSGVPFLELIEELRPSRVVITSLTSWKSMPPTHLNHPSDDTENCAAYRLSDGTLVWCLAVPHQRARRMGWRALGDAIAAFRRQQLPIR